MNAAGAFAEVSVGWTAPYADRCALQIRRSGHPTETIGGHFVVVRDRFAHMVRLEEWTTGQPVVRARRTRSKVTTEVVKSYALACAKRLLKGTEPGRVLARRVK